MLKVQNQGVCRALLFLVTEGENTVLLTASGICQQFLVFLDFFFFFFFFLKIFYLFTHERQREAEIQAEGEAGSMQEALCGTRSLVSRITPGLKVALNP